MTLLLVAPLVAAAANLTAEERLSAQVQAGLSDGEALRLEAAGRGFLAVYRRSVAPERLGAVVLLHGREGHADAAMVLRPLALGLAAAGWDTLALQLPVATAATPDRVWRGLVPEAAPRIRAALGFLTERDIDIVVLLGHDLGAQMLVHFLANEPSPAQIKGAVLLGLEGPDPGNTTPLREQLRALELPLLDLYGERDLPAVLAGAPQRRLAASDATNPGYTQVALPGADHWFTGLDALLVSRVRSWLNRLAVPQ